MEFKKLNLTSNFHFSDKFDLILCRNVLIYQNVERKKEILKRLTGALVPRGLFLLGSGESLIGLSSDFEQLNSDGAVLYKKKDAALKAA